MKIEKELNNKLNCLGNGILIGLIYGVGGFFMAWFKDKRIAPIGLVFFLIAFLLHRRSLNQMEIGEENK